MLPIQVYIGSSERFRVAEDAIVNSIHRNTNHNVEIRIITPEGQGVPPTGCTGFSNLRYAVPELAGYSGFAIYLDVDMVVLGDISELLEYAEAGKWVCMRDGSTEVSVISCGTHRHLPPLRDLHKYKKHELKAMIREKRAIPPEWNVEDRVEEGMKLLHFTDLKCQPWFYDHPCQEAVDIYRAYA